MKHSQLRSFHAIAEQGSFSGAAEVLGIGQPVVSRQLKALEENYQIHLFERQGRQLHLSQYGRVLHQYTKEIFNLEKNAQDLLNHAAGVEYGQLIIATTTTRSLQPLLAEFHKNLPNIDFIIKRGGTLQIKQWLMAMEIDIALAPDLGEAESITSVVNKTHDLVISYPRNHLFQGRTSLDIKELEGQDLLLMQKGSYVRGLFEKEAKKQQVSYRVKVQSDCSNESLIDLVMAGIGIGVTWNDAISAGMSTNFATLETNGQPVNFTSHYHCLASRRDYTIINYFMGLAEDRVR